jgi:hypothetical protein
MSAGYNQFVSNRRLKVTNIGNHHFVTTPSAIPLSTMGQLGQFMPSEPKRTLNGLPKIASMSSEQEAATLIQLLSADIHTLTLALTQRSTSSVGHQFEPIDAMNDLLNQVEHNRKEGNTAAMKSNIRQLHEVGSRFNFNGFGAPSRLMEMTLKSILDHSAKYADFDGTEPVAAETKESPPRGIEAELDRYRGINRLSNMYKKRRHLTVPRSGAGSGTSSGRGQRPKSTRRRPGVKMRVRLTRSAATGKIADLLKQGPRNLILISQGHTHYTFQYNSGNHPKSADISKDDVVVKPIITMDKPDVLKTGMLVQVKYVDQPWWTGKYLEMPATEEQLAKLKGELNKPLIVLKQKLKRLRTLNSEEDRPKWMALNRSTIDEQRQENNQYKRQARQKYEKMQRGLYVVEDDVATFVDVSSMLKTWDFAPYGDDKDDWRFPDCPLITMSTEHIRVLNIDGVFEPVTVTEIGETDGLDTAPEHIVFYERQHEPGVAYTLDTWYQQYKLGWNDDNTDPEDTQDSKDYVYNSENDAPPFGDSDMDEVWEHLYNVNDTVELAGQRGTVSNVDAQNRSYTINFETSAVSNVQEDELVPPEQLQYTPGHLVLYNFRVCRIIRLNANNYTLEQSPHQAENIEALFQAFQSSGDQDWRTFLFTGAETLNEVSDRALQEYCLIQTNGVRSICKKNGVTKRNLKLLNERGKKRKVTLNSKNIKEPEEVNDIIEAMFRQEHDDTVDQSYLDFEVGQAVEVYDNGQMMLTHRRLAALHQELENLEDRLAQEKRKKWKSLYRSDIDKKKQEIMQYQGLVSGKWPIGYIVEHETNKIKEQESYRVEVNGTTRSYNVSQLGSLQPVPSSMSGAARLAAGVDDAAVDDAAGVDEYIDSETEDIAMSNSADENDKNDSGLDEEWVPLAEIGDIVKISPTNEILSVDSIDYGSEQTKMSDGNKYRNEQFDIYIENIESESDDPSKYATDDETDSEDSDDEL